MMPVFIQGQHLDRNMPCCRILFQMVEHGPSQHVREEHIQRDGSGMEFTRKGECLRTIHRHQDLETLVVRQIAKDARIVRVVFDDQQDCVIGLKVRAVIGNPLRSPTRQRLPPTGAARLRFCGRVATLVADGPT